MECVSACWPAMRSTGNRGLYWMCGSSGTCGVVIAVITQARGGTAGGVSVLLVAPLSFPHLLPQPGLKGRCALEGFPCVITRFAVVFTIIILQ